MTNTQNYYAAQLAAQAQLAAATSTGKKLQIIQNFESFHFTFTHIGTATIAGSQKKSAAANSESR